MEQWFFRHTVLRKILPQKGSHMLVNYLDFFFFFNLAINHQLNFLSWGNKKSLSFSNDLSFFKQKTWKSKILRPSFKWQTSIHWIQGAELTDMSHYFVYHLTEETLPRYSKKFSNTIWSRFNPCFPCYGTLCFSDKDFFQKQYVNIIEVLESSISISFSPHQKVILLHVLSSPSLINPTDFNPQTRHCLLPLPWPNLKCF